MAVLFVHLGAPLTGGTLVKSVLDTNKSMLESAGMRLQLEPEASVIERGLWTAENDQQFDKKWNPSGFTPEKTPNAHRNLVVSSKKRWSDLEQKHLKGIPTLNRNGYGFERVKLLLFVRNPIDRVVNMWRQRVKFNGCTDELEDFMKNKNDVRRFLERTETLIDWASQESDFELTVLNFTHIGDDKPSIVNVIAEWLEMDSDRLVYPGVEPYLRLYDLGEVRLQLELNRTMGIPAIELAKALAARDPDMELTKPKPSAQSQREIWNEVKPVVDRINMHIPEGNRMVFDRVEPLEKEEYFFNEVQLRIIAQCLGGQIKDIRDSESKAMSIFRRLSNTLRNNGI